MTVVACVGDPPPAEAIEQATEALRRGQVVVVPTDTVYGLAVLAAHPAAAARVFALKRRPAGVALPVLVGGPAQLGALVDHVPEVARRLMERWWPGGLTLVLRRRPGVRLELGGADDGTIGVRLPAHPVPVALALEAGPLAVTSANLHGHPTPATAAGVVSQLGADPGVVLDAGPCAGAASTVVSCTGDGLQLLREGTVPFADIVTVAGTAERPGDDAAGP